eukprot:15448958-Alexandrium_andersonii.AAC.1
MPTGGDPDSGGGPAGRRGGEGGSPLATTAGGDSPKARDPIEALLALTVLGPKVGTRGGLGRVEMLTLKPGPMRLLKRGPLLLRRSLLRLLPLRLDLKLMRAPGT